MEAKKKFNIIFVCTGNTCRSPMAEFMFKAYLKEKKRQGDFNVQSAGLYARKGDVMSSTAAEALTALGVKHNEKRRSKAFTVMMAEDSDLIVAMTARHADLIGDGNVISFEKLIGSPIDDPFGGSLQSYLDCAKSIRLGFDNLLALCDRVSDKQ
ncbi:MAG: low molecular weight protein arginine phosphatase [Clostridiales bacterium]|nr:low molecular weight protein arginine phosphatase [Clostridiales bacterium]